MKKLNKCMNEFLEKIKPIELEPVPAQPFQLDLVEEVDKWNKRMDETLERAKKVRKQVKNKK